MRMYYLRLAIILAVLYVIFPPGGRSSGDASHIMINNNKNKIKQDSIPHTVLAFPTTAAGQSAGQ